MLANKCSKFSKPGFNSMRTENFQMFKLDLEKAEEQQIKLPTRKTSNFALLTTPKLLTVWIIINCGKILKIWEYQTTWPASWEICMQVKSQQLELYMEQQTGSKTKKESVKAVYCHPAYLTYMQSTSCEMLGWIKHKLKIKIAWRNINNLRYADDTTLIGESKEELKSFLMWVREEWKSRLNTQH